MDPATVCAAPDQAMAVAPAVSAGAAAVRAINYSERSIAVLGDTFAHKAVLAAAGGSWNGFLTVDGTKAKGWVFSASKRDAVNAIVVGIGGTPAPQPPAASASCQPLAAAAPEGTAAGAAGAAGVGPPTHASSAGDASAPNADASATAAATTGLRVVRYSAKAVAVLGGSHAIKNALAAAGGRWNAALTFEGARVKGWVFSASRAAAVNAIVGSAGGATLVAGNATAAPATAPTAAAPACVAAAAAAADGADDSPAASAAVHDEDAAAAPATVVYGEQKRRADGTAGLQGKRRRSDDGRPEQ